MAIKFRIMVEAKAPQVVSVADDATFEDLQRTIATSVLGMSSETDAPLPEHMRILFGFPPREITDIPATAQLSTTDLARGGSLRVKTGDTTTQHAPTTAATTSGQATTEATTGATTEAAATVTTATASPLSTSTPVARGGSQQHAATPKPHPLRVTVPADNSCLFRSIIFLADCPPGGMSAITDDEVMTMRLLVASLIQSDPDRFNEAVLGRPVQEYLAWITDSSHWGGYIELTALARALRVTIRAIDVKTLRTEEYVGVEGCDECCYVLYDGVHYDPLVMAMPGQGGGVVGGGQDGDEAHMVKQFSCMDEETKGAMLAFARELHELRQFTDVNDFALMCLDCSKGLKGQEEARLHSMQTGHINFCETKE